jgi:hypothetical protein
MRRLAPCVFAVCIAAAPARSQTVVAKGATPTTAIDALKAYLEPQGFHLVRSDAKEAVLGLDLGIVPQHGLYHGRHGDNLFRVVMELHVRFKPKADGLELNAYEDATILDRDSSLVERRRVRTHQELDNIRQLMEEIRRQLEGRASPESMRAPHD